MAKTTAIFNGQKVMAGPAFPQRVWVSALLAMAAIALAFGAFLVIQNFMAPKLPNQLDNSMFEQRYGIRITQIAVTGEGGLIDLRFQVVDPEKARTAMEDPNLQPVVFTKDSTDPISTNITMNHGKAMEVGRIYWMIYYNTKSALHSGSVVAIQMGDLKLENVLVQ